MPIFEFECDSCQHVTEKVCRITDESREAECEECKGKAHKIVSQSTFHLKGSGWEKDDYTSAKDKGRNMGVAV